MKILLTTLLLGFVFPVSIASQTFFEQPIKEDLLKGRVKQIEEFMARFNYEEDWEGRKVDDNTDTVMRAKYIHTLFDYSRFRKEDGKLTDVAEQFIQNVVRQGSRIHFSDSTWMARVQCEAMVKGKTYAITLYLRTRQIAQNEYIWCIVKADSPLFAPPTKPSSRPFISPIEHEVGFTGLLSLPSIQNQDVTRLFPQENVFDNLSMLAVLLKNGIISFTNINDINFQFLSIPGYSFSVERVERKNSYNTGWLITSLHPL